MVVCVAIVADVVDTCVLVDGLLPLSSICVVSFSSVAVSFAGRLGRFGGRAVAGCERRPAREGPDA